MAAGTSGNLSWGEAAAADVTEPAEALKTIGYGVDEVPTHEEFNWSLKTLGRAAVRRFASTELLIQSRRAGDTATAEDVGLVLPFGGLGAANVPVWNPDWHQAGDANESEICSDGEYLWTVAGAGANRFLRRRLRLTGAIDLDEPAPINFDYPFVACAGGNVYVLDDAAGTPQIRVFDRVALSLLYSVALPGAATAYGLATDGYYVAVAAGNFIRLYHDTGAALTLDGSYDHTAQVNSVAMDGRTILLGGATPGASDQLRTLAYGAGAPTLSTTLNRAGNPQVLRVAFVDEQIAFEGDVDGTDYTGFFRNEIASTMRCNLLIAANDVKIVNGMVAFARNGTIAFVDPNNSDPIKSILWDGGAATAVNRLSYDNDALFVLGAATGAGTRLRRYSIHNQPRLYRVVDPTSVTLRRYGGVHSLVQPIR
jgi:hypothetical protein